MDVEPVVLPAEPKTKPRTSPPPAPSKPSQPRRILKPTIHPGADPAPKANSNKHFDKIPTKFDKPESNKKVK